MKKTVEEDVQDFLEFILDADEETGNFPDRTKPPPAPPIGLLYATGWGWGVQGIARVSMCV